MTLTLADFDYHLPPQRIAQAPLSERSASRLLVLANGRCVDRRFVDLPDLLAPGDLLVLNDSRVLHARLLGQKASGGQVEVLIERMTTPTRVLAQIRASKPPRAQTTLWLEDALAVTVIQRCGALYELEFDADAAQLIEAHGRLPLPPYIERAAIAADEARYQTVYAQTQGSVAAPTAGLHFDQDLLQRLAERGIACAFVTLHVGAGTFQPVRVDDLTQHRMHTERWQLPAATADAIRRTRARGGKIVAVGTTSLRTLEAAALAGDGEIEAAAGETDLFITPGFEFRVADRLITNFHLPKSTLLMLVSAFAGLAETRAAYTHAIESGYRFFSYGDAMLLTRSGR